MAYARFIGMEVRNFSVEENPSQASLDALVDEIKNYSPQGVIGAGFSQACPKVMKSLRSKNWFPNAWTELACAADTTLTIEDIPDAIYTLDVTEYDRRMEGERWTDDFWYPPDPINGLASAELVAQDLERSFNATAQWSIPVVMSAGLVLHKALEYAGTTETEAVKNAISRFYEMSFVGPIGFSQWGQNNVKDPILLQLDEKRKLQIVFPLGQSKSEPFLFPAPNFSERSYTFKYLRTTPSVILAVICVVLTLSSLALCIFVGMHRNRKVVAAASPLFLGAILLGSVLMYSAYWFWQFETDSTASCHLRAWLTGIGFVLLFGSLFAKTWRIMRIFASSKPQILRVTNPQLLLVLGALLGIEIILLILYSALARPQMTVYSVDPRRASLNKQICTTTSAGRPILIVLIIYKFLLVAFGIYMTFQVWNIPLKLYNESRAIAFSLYNVLCLLAMWLAFEGSSAGISGPTLFVIRSSLLFSMVFLTILAVFVRKIRGIYCTTPGNSNENFPTYDMTQGDANGMTTISPNEGALKEKVKDSTSARATSKDSKQSDGQSSTPAVPFNSPRSDPNPNNPIAKFNAGSQQKHYGLHHSRHVNNRHGLHQMGDERDVDEHYLNVNSSSSGTIAEETTTEYGYDMSAFEDNQGSQPGGAWGRSSSGSSTGDDVTDDDIFDDDASSVDGVAIYPKLISSPNLRISQSMSTAKDSQLQHKEEDHSDSIYDDDDDIDDSEEESSKTIKLPELPSTASRSTVSASPRIHGPLDSHSTPHARMRLQNRREIPSTQRFDVPEPIHVHIPDPHSKEADSSTTEDSYVSDEANKDALKPKESISASIARRIAQSASNRENNDSKQQREMVTKVETVTEVYKTENRTSNENHEVTAEESRRKRILVVRKDAETAIASEGKSDSDEMSADADFETAVSESSVAY